MGSRCIWTFHTSLEDRAPIVAVKSGPSHKYDHEANPDAGAEIEAHPKNLISPVFTGVSHLAARESVFQSVTNPEITQTRALAGSPSRYVDGDIDKHDHSSRGGGSEETNRNPQG